MADIIDITDLDSGKTININSSIEEIKIGGAKSSNFGTGIELLMNDKKKLNGNSGLSSDFDINDLNNLEDELNELTIPDGRKNIKEARSDIFYSGIKLKEDDTHSIPDLDSPPPEVINLGQSTKEQSNDEKKTWDGYGKFNNIPINPDFNKIKV